MPQNTTQVVLIFTNAFQLQLKKTKTTPLQLLLKITLCSAEGVHISAEYRVTPNVVCEHNLQEASADVMQTALNL
jgi:hypothetical protein